MGLQKLKDGLQKLEFTQEEIESISKKMDKYISEIILFNSAYNLTNTSDYDEIVVNHILDSLSAVKMLKRISLNYNKDSLVIGDIGSGGGLPGIPLATALPNIQFTLVERMDKRCAFLENCAAILSLNNVNVLKKEAEKVKPNSFDITTFRAFRPLDKKMIQTLLSLTKEGGILAAYKAKTESIKAEMQGIKQIVKEYEIKELHVPFLTDNPSVKENRERNLVLVKVFPKN